VSNKPHLARAKKRPMPSIWASWKPFGIGEQRPNNYAEVFRAAWESRGDLRYAWRILTRGVCDGCALGTNGLVDWTVDGVHLCNVRLRLLKLNTMPAFDPAILADVAPLQRRRSAALRDLGRLAYPMIRHRGDAGFRRLSWDAALDLVAERIRASSPERLGFYLTSRGLPNETYYAAQKAVRALGTNNIDNAARICHSPSTVALKRSIGVAATTCSYSDWIGSDLIVFIGCNPASNQPVTTKYLHYAKKAGTKVVMINAYREPGMERYWVPSVPESALFGTKIVDETFLINIGGDIAFLGGALKHLIEQGWVDQDFVARHTSGFAELKAATERQAWPDLERLSGASREAMLSFARMLGEAGTGVLVWSMGVTQHEFGEDNVSAIVNLGLARGFVGRDRCGLMPIRGHSGVQGGAEMGAYATALPGGLPINAETAAHFSALWGFEVPTAPGLAAPQLIDAAAAGRLDLLYASGSNFMEVLPDPVFVEHALASVPLRVHQDIVLTSQMLVEPADSVLLLPAATRYEVPGGVTETSTERRVIFSPEIPGPRRGEARPEWEIFLDLARRARPDLADRLHFDGTPAMRAEIARAVPFYDGIQHLHAQGDQFQYGGPHLCADGNFDMPGGLARFFPIRPPETQVPEGMFRVATRRGKQFNSMVYEKVDPINGAPRRAVMMNQGDAETLGLNEGDQVVLYNDVGEFVGQVFTAPVQPHNLMIHWPEGNALLDHHRRSPGACIPDYNALVRMAKVDGALIDLLDPSLPADLSEDAGDLPAAPQDA
jgi:molybdopterin-dependent oxidoreductase alpha subunit